MERIYNKLVRDNIPNIIKSKGETPVTRILSEDEYKNELEKKLYEEYKEVIEASGSDRIDCRHGFFSILITQSVAGNQRGNNFLCRAFRIIQRAAVFGCKAACSKSQR